MNYSFTSKNFNADESIKNFAIEKINHHLGRLLPENTNINVAFIEIGYEKKVEVTIYLNKRIIRAEFSNKENMRGAIDEVVDILRKQVRRYKNRLDAISKKTGKLNDELNLLPKVDFNDFNNNNGNGDNLTDNNISGNIKIERVKSFAIKPMDAEEAAMEIELLGHDFYVFLNSDTDQVNVIYKRKNGSYGLIEPKYK